MVTMIRRSQWGARKPRETPTKLDKDQQRGLAIHHSGSRADERQDHRQCAAVVARIQRHHQDAMRWNDVAYNWLGCHHGGLFEGRGLGVQPASQGPGDGNTRWHSFCYLGHGDDFDGDDGAAMPAYFARGLVLRHVLTAHLVWPHLRFSSTECPGRALRQWCRQFPD